MSARIDLRGELGDIADQLRTQGVAADIDRDRVNLPGVWVTTSGLTLDGLDYYTVHARLLAIAADNSTENYLDAMTEVANHVLALWNPEGDMTPVTVNRAGTPLPALSIPVDFRCEYAPAPPEEEE